MWVGCEAAGRIELLHSLPVELVWCARKPWLGLALLLEGSCRGWLELVNQFVACRRLSQTGEEAETALVDMKCKLYRFDPESSEWKERGIGQVQSWGRCIPRSL